MERRKTVTVACRVMNGLSVRLHKRGEDDGTGARPMIADGAPVRLAGPSSIDAGVGSTERLDEVPITTEVDAEWWGKWHEQNKLNPFVSKGLVYALEDRKEDPSSPESEAA